MKRKRTEDVSFDVFPIEVIIHILSFCDCRTKRILSGVSRIFFDALYDYPNHSIGNVVCCTEYLFANQIDTSHKYEKQIYRMGSSKRIERKKVWEYQHFDRFNKKLEMETRKMGGVWDDSMKFDFVEVMMFNEELIFGNGLVQFLEGFNNLKEIYIKDVDFSVKMRKKKNAIKSNKDITFFWCYEYSEDIINDNAYKDDKFKVFKHKIHQHFPKAKVEVGLFCNLCRCMKKNTFTLIPVHSSFKTCGHCYHKSKECVRCTRLSITEKNLCKHCDNHFKSCHLCKEVGKKMEMKPCCDSFICFDCLPEIYIKCIRCKKIYCMNYIKKNKKQPCVNGLHCKLYKIKKHPF